MVVNDPSKRQTSLFFLKINLQRTVFLKQIIYTCTLWLKHICDWFKGCWHLFNDSICTSILKLIGLHCNCEWIKTSDRLSGSLQWLISVLCKYRIVIQPQVIAAVYSSVSYSYIHWTHLFCTSFFAK